MSCQVKYEVVLFSGPSTVVRSWYRETRELGRGTFVEPSTCESVAREIRSQVPPLGDEDRSNVCY